MVKEGRPHQGEKAKEKMVGKEVGYMQEELVGKVEANTLKCSKVLKWLARMSHAKMAVRGKGLENHSAHQEGQGTTSPKVEM